MKVLISLREILTGQGHFPPFVVVPREAKAAAQQQAATEAYVPESAWREARERALPEMKEETRPEQARQAEHTALLP
jgi:hypothetical protein